MILLFIANNLMFFATAFACCPCFCTLFKEIHKEGDTFFRPKSKIILCTIVAAAVAIFGCAFQFSHEEAGLFFSWCGIELLFVVLPLTLLYRFQKENTYDIKISEGKKAIVAICVILSNILFALNYSAAVANKAGYDISFLLFKPYKYDRNFFEDIKSNRISKVELSVKNVADINAKDRYGKTALHIAVIHNCEEIVKILIDNGADVNAIDGYLFRKLTPIHYAAINNNTAITKLLIDAGADINFQTHEGSSPLIIACCKNNTETAVVLIENGANVNEYYKAHNEYNCHYSPIKYAIKNGNGLLTKVLIFNGAFVAQETGFSPLHVAAIYNRADIIDLLIANNAYVNVIYTTGGKHKKYYTPLDYATQHNNIESIDKLISYGGIRKR